MTHLSVCVCVCLCMREGEKEVIKKEKEGSQLHVL